MLTVLRMDVSDHDVAADKTTFAVLTFILLGVSFHAIPDHVFGPTEKASFMAYK